jgi:hypothetical protein
MKLLMLKWWNEIEHMMEVDRSLQYQMLGNCEPTLTGAPWRMDGKWFGNNFLLGSSSLANHGG